MFIAKTWRFHDSNGSFGSELALVCVLVPLAQPASNSPRTKITGLPNVTIGFGSLPRLKRSSIPPILNTAKLNGRRAENAACRAAKIILLSFEYNDIKISLYVLE